MIKVIKLRRDGLRTSPFAAHQCDMTVLCSNTTGTPPKGYGFRWDGNYGNDAKQVMKKKTIQWGADPQPTTPPARFNVVFPLDLPFPYLGKSFLIEWTSDFTIPSSTYNYNWVTDAELDSQWENLTWGEKIKAGTRREYGTGCPTDFRNYAIYPYAGSEWHHYGHCRVASNQTPCFMLLGTNDKKFGPITLPFDLSPLGANGCNLYVDIVQVFPTLADPGSTTGEFHLELGFLPNEPFLVGASYYVQMMALHPSYNSLGLGASPGREYTIGSGFAGSTPAFCIYGYKQNAQETWNLATTGGIYYSPRANIVEFTY